MRVPARAAIAVRPSTSATLVRRSAGAERGGSHRAEQEDEGDRAQDRNTDPEATHELGTVPARCAAEAARDLVA